MDTWVTSALSRFDVDALEAHASLIYAVDADLRLRFINETYRRAAALHPPLSRDYPLGTRIVEGIRAPLRRRFTARFEAAMIQEKPETADYHCPTPEEERLFRATLYPLDGQGLLMVHGPIRRRRWEVRELNRLRDPRTELLTMCSGCRRACGPERRWQNVPQLLRETPERVSHGLCDQCVEFYLGA